MKAERFWAKVHMTSSCWLWTGGRTITGYGRAGSRPAHRVAYELAVGPIPDGLEIDHLCRVTSCVNPTHLEVVTHQENMRRTIRATKTHCLRGHLLPPDRRCQPCLRLRSRQWHQREREKAARSPNAS